MPRLYRRLATGFVAVLAALLPVAFLSPAYAADTTAAAKAADFLDQSFSQTALDGINGVGDYNFGAATVANGISALSAAGGHDEAVTRMAAWLKSRAADYVGTSAPRAGYIAIAAATLGVDPTTYFDGVDLVSVMSSALDPTTGQYLVTPDYGPSPLNQALVIIGLARNGEDVPEIAVDYLISLQTTDGMFGYGSPVEPNNDATSYALMALSLVPDVQGVGSAYAKGVSALVSRQASDGYWEDFSWVNTTGLAASALEDAGVDASKATAWMVGQQRGDGGLPDGQNEADAASNIAATIDGLLLLAGESYATATFTATPPAPETTALSAAPTTSSAAVAVVDPADPVAQGAAGPELAATGFEPGVPLTSGLGAVALGAVLLWVGRESRRRPAYARKH